MTASGGIAPHGRELHDEQARLARPLRDRRAGEVLGQAEGVEDGCNCAGFGHHRVHVPLCCRLRILGQRSSGCNTNTSPRLLYTALRALRCRNLMGSACTTKEVQPLATPRQTCGLPPEMTTDHPETTALEAGGVLARSTELQACAWVEAPEMVGSQQSLLQLCSQCSSPTSS